MTLRSLNLGSARLQSSALVISDEACLAAGLDAFRAHAGAAPDVTVGWFGSRIAPLHGNSDLAPEVTRGDSEADCAAALPAAYEVVDQALAVDGLNIVRGLPLWELIKESVFYDLRLQLADYSIALCWVRKARASDIFLYQSASAAQIAGALRSACAASGVKLHILAGSNARRLPRYSLRQFEERCRDWTRRTKISFAELMPRSATSQQSRILFTAFYPTNAHLLLAVRDALAGEEARASGIAAGTFAVWRHLRTAHADRSIISPFHFSDRRLVSHARDLSGRASRRLRALIQSPLEDSVVRYIARWTADHYRSVVWHVETNMRLLEQTRPAVIATTTQWGIPAKSHVMSAACLCGIPVIWIQHGLATVDDFTGPLYFDRLAVWGDRDIALWRPFGVDLSRIELTGGINFDNLTAPASGLSVGRGSSGSAERTVLFTTQPAGTSLSIQEHEETLGWFLHAATVFPRVRFIVKPHPTERSSQYRLRIRQLGQTNIEVRDADQTERLIAIADVVVTIFSTTGMSAVALGKPLITLQAPGAPDRGPYAAENVAARATSAASFQTVLQSLFDSLGTTPAHSPEQRCFVRNYMGPLDGRAAKRCAALISRVSVESEPAHSNATGAVPVSR
jgi:hypothetical protein